MTEYISYLRVSTQKKCVKCKEQKPIDNFRSDKRYRSGLFSYCKDCERLTSRECYQKAKEKYQLKNREKYLKNRKQRLLSSAKWRRTNIKKRLIYLAKRRAKEKNLPFNLKESDIIIPKKCPVLGLVLEKEMGENGYAPLVTLDRIAPVNGYVRGNVCVISHRANGLKSNGRIEEFEKILKYMKQGTNFLGIIK